MNTDFWLGRKVFMTGHTGFKGSWLTILLKHLGAEVTGYALNPPVGQPSLFEEAAVGADCRSIIGDIRDLDHLQSEMLSASPTVVLHLAAQSLVRPSYDQPVETYSTNVMGTVNVLEVARAVLGLQAVVVITSDKCYENREWVWGYRENDPMGGYDPYSSSKGCAELVAAAYAKSFFSAPSAARIGTARAGNVIGGGDYAVDRLVPDLIRAFASGQPAIIRNPVATRPWQHVLEPLVGYLMLAERLATSSSGFEGGWNFGPSPESVCKVQSVADSLVKRWGCGASWAQSEGEAPHEAQSLSLECAKARTKLGWSPLLELDTALSWIVDWTQATRSGSPARVECLRQVKRYLELQDVNSRGLNVVAGASQ